jgi:hypothetical protein
MRLLSRSPLALIRVSPRTQRDTLGARNQVTKSRFDTIACRSPTVDLFLFFNRLMWLLSGIPISAPFLLFVLYYWSQSLQRHVRQLNQALFGHFCAEFTAAYLISHT